jgi:(2Fe-2S) ferredoxin
MAAPYQHHIFFCTNERSADDPKGSCLRRGSGALHAHAKEVCHQQGLKGVVRVNKAGCLDVCERGPAVVVYGEKDPPGGVWYTVNSREDVDEIVDSHLVSGNVVERLKMKMKGD